MIVQKFARKISKKKCILYGILTTMILILFAIIISGFGVYIFDWDDNFLIRGSTRLIPYPIMRINGNFISFSEYQKDVDTLVKFYNYETKTTGLPTPSLKNIKINILERLKRNEIIKQMAEKENISIGKEEINNEFYKIMARAGSPETAEETLKNLYGWSEKEFKKRIVRVIILQEKLKNKLGVEINLDEKINEELKKADIKEYIK